MSRAPRASILLAMATSFGVVTSVIGTCPRTGKTSAASLRITYSPDGNGRQGIFSDEFYLVREAKTGGLGRPLRGPFGGEGGIRTRGGCLALTRFPGVRLKPLIHLSGGRD